jgi:predicted Fe-S protein YdhL (DUF1289 family)
MKKIILLTLVFISNISFAQIDKAAENVTNKMSSAMELTNQEKEEVLQLVTQRNADRKALKEKFGDDVAGFKLAGKEIEVDFNKNLRDYVGNKKMKMWADFNKVEKEKKENPVKNNLEILADNMQEIMDLTDEEKSKVNSLLADRKNQRIALKKEYEHDQDGFNKAIKKMEGKFNQDLTLLVGKERKQKWNTYNIEKKEN